MTAIQTSTVVAVAGAAVVGLMGTLRSLADTRPIHLPKQAG